MTVLPRAILFDLDETLLSFGKRPLLLAEVAEEFAAALAPIAPAEAAEILEAHFRDFWSDPERHKIWRFQLGAARRKLVGDVFEALRPRAAGLTSEIATAFATRFHAYREEQARFFPGALEAVDELKRRGVKLALVTNGAGDVQRAKIEKFDLTHRFEHIQIEGEAGFGKPEEQAYLHAMAALGVAPHETWMVGDNLEWEVAAPQRLGIHAIWHDHLGAGLPKDSLIKPDRIILSIGELTENLG
ncbi:MAG: HAD family hydrolase [Phenylobacterium sp.]|uniref:HAD family hydrolase n=1 Tax=Phenylobacterium sp. TaxID=1871053 RepID=UPI003BB4E625